MYSAGAIPIIEPHERQRQMTTPMMPIDHYINLRILTYDTNKDGKREIIIVKNLSSSGRTFQRVKLFTSAEVYNLEWDGMGMVENWRTKKISGYVADYQFKDIDNDGENEVVLALVLSVGGAIKGQKRDRRLLSERRIEGVDNSNESVIWDSRLDESQRAPTDGNAVHTAS